MAETMLVGLGLPRSGTHYLARAVLPPRRAAHEFDAQRHCVVAAEYLQGRVSAASMARYLQRRVALGGLAADVSSINAHGAHLWPEVVAQARFVFTFREPLDWVDAFARHELWHTSSSKHWRHLRAARLRPDRWPAQAADDPLRAIGVGSLDGLLHYWAGHVRQVLCGVPPGQLLVVATEQLDGSLDRISDFLCWPREALIAHDRRDGVPAAIRRAPPVSAQLDPAHVARVMRRQLSGTDWERLGVAEPWQLR